MDTPEAKLTTFTTEVKSLTGGITLDVAAKLFDTTDKEDETPDKFRGRLAARTANGDLVAATRDTNRTQKIFEAKAPPVLPTLEAAMGASEAQSIQTHLNVDIQHLLDIAHPENSITLSTNDLLELKRDTQARNLPGAGTEQMTSLLMDCTRHTAVYTGIIEGVTGNTNPEIQVTGEVHENEKDLGVAYGAAAIINAHLNELAKSPATGAIEVTTTPAEQNAKEAVKRLQEVRDRMVHSNRGETLTRVLNDLFPERAADLMLL